jgi:hypothetical protein
MPPDSLDAADVNVKEVFGLPDSLPPIRLPALPELAALARQAPLPRQLSALVSWVGDGGRPVDEAGDLTSENFRAASAALALDHDEDLVFLWDYALAVDWLAFDEDSGDRVVPGETAAQWRSGEDHGVFDSWSSTLAAVLSETIDVSGPANPDDLAEMGLAGLDFYGQPMALAMLAFMTRRDGLSLTDFTEVLWENASADMPDDEAAKARKKWIAYYDDPARLLLDKLTELHAVTRTGDVIWLTPLALAALREQLADAGVDIPLLPATAAELTGAELLAMAAGVREEEFEAETDAWVAARGAAGAASELLTLAAAAEPGERLLAVAAVQRLGAAAEPAWRRGLDVPALRGYAKIALPAGSPDLDANDLAWMATDVLALICDDEFPDPAELADSFREAVLPGQEAALFEAMSRGSHPHAPAVLTYVGRHHPDKQIAKAARTAAHKATSRLPKVQAEQAGGVAAQ